MVSAAETLAGSRAAVARAITLVESTRPDDRAAARALLAELAPYTGRAHRIGISGVPGAGKSTLIDRLGTMIADGGRRVAVLTVDPSSERTGGSLLGDATRMSGLAAHPDAFVRSSPSAGRLGGVAPGTRAAIAVVEAAGYDIVLIETVGVGQSETAVAALVDTFVLVAAIGTGDELQGVKMGVLELVDVIAVNKVDGERVAAGKATARDLSTAMRLVSRGGDRTTPAVLTCSARDGSGVAELWEHITDRFAERSAAGEVRRRRREQDVAGMWSTARTAVLAGFDADARVATLAEEFISAVDAGTTTATEAGERLAAAFRDAGRHPVHKTSTSVQTSTMYLVVE